MSSITPENIALQETWKRFFKGTGLCLAFLCVYLVVVYGTISPCGILRKRTLANFMQEMQTDESTSFEALGAVVAIPMVNSLVDSMGPVQCVQSLIRLGFSEKPVLNRDDIHDAGMPLTAEEFLKHNPSPGKDTDYGAPLSAEEFLKSR